MSAGPHAVLPGNVQLLTDFLRQRHPVPTAAPHLVFLLDEFPQTLGGGERVVLRLAALLTGAGYRVSIVTFRVHPACTALNDAPCPVYLLPITSVFRPHAARAAWQLGCFLRRERVAVVETFFESANLFGGLVTRIFSRARLVWNRRDMGILREPRHKILYRWLRRLPGGGLPHHLIAVSEQVREHAIAVDDIPRAHTTVIYNAVDPSPWLHTEPAPADAAIQRVVCLGNLRPVKGQDVLLEAAGRLAASFPSMRIEFAGAVLEPEYLRQLEARRDALGLQQVVHFLGPVQDLPAYLHRAAICVLPSRSEGFSNALLEAMAAGLPVVATDVGGNREAVDDGVTGYIVPADDVPSLSEALATLLRHPRLRLSMGTAGRERVFAKFGRSAVLRQMLDLYGALTARRSTVAATRLGTAGRKRQTSSEGNEL